MNGSSVIAKIAGMESTAKITSTMPIIRITTNSGVAIRTPSRTVKNFSPSNPGEMRIFRLIHFSTGLLPRSGSCPAAHHILMPVSSRNAPKTYSSQWNCSSSQAPTRIRIARSTIAPRMPIIRTRFWYSAGTAKYVNTIRKTKMLSTASAFSIR